MGQAAKGYASEIKVGSHWSLYVPLGLIFKNFTFCPQEAFMYLQQTAIIYS